MADTTAGTMAGTTAGTKTVTCTDGLTIRYYDEVIGSGAMKDVYFSTDGSQALAFFREPLDAAGVERLQMIAGRYRELIFDAQYGDYWSNLFCWPTNLITDGGRTGVVLPKYREHFFFEHGSVNDDFLGIRGCEKEGKWFAAPVNRMTRLDPRERGDWRMYLRICLMIARAVRRMHAAGLAHSDLSYKNVLISPSSGHACIIDVDGLVVPGKFPPDVVGTPDFIAPEVVATAHLPRDHPGRFLPNIKTDRHALAVMIYQYLLLRHPLRGRKIHDPNDPNNDEKLTMGERALFVEHPGDASNRTLPEKARPAERFWQDTVRLPYTVTGPYLSELFRHAFIDGLHEPAKRPTADEWEQALIKTVDLIQPCENANCDAAWYAFDNSTRPACPFCGTPYRGQLPVINLYSDRGEGRFLPDNHRLMIYRDQSIFPWHVDRTLIPNERLDSRDSRRVGYCIYHKGRWLFVNETLDNLDDLSHHAVKRKIGRGESVVLQDGLRLLIRRGNNARLLVVQLVDGG